MEQPPKPMMSIRDIIITDSKKNHINLDPSRALKAFEVALGEPDVMVLREGNSLIVAEDLGDGHGEFHFINAERLQDFVTNVIILFGRLADLGYKEIVTNFWNPRVLEVVKQLPQDCSVTRGIVAGKEQYILTVRL